MYDTNIQTLHTHRIVLFIPDVQVKRYDTMRLEGKASNS